MRSIVALVAALILVFPAFGAAQGVDCLVSWTWTPSPADPTQAAIGYYLYIAADEQAVRDRTVTPLTVSLPTFRCADVGLDEGEYLGISAYDAEGNESPVSIVQRRTLLKPEGITIRYTITIEGSQ